MIIDIIVGIFLFCAGLLIGLAWSFGVSNGYYEYGEKD